jgi:hypothetical protein
MIHGSFGKRIAEMVDRLTRDRPDGTKLSVEVILNDSHLKKEREVLLFVVLLAPLPYLVPYKLAKFNIIYLILLEKNVLL